jgi:transposase
MQHIQGISRNQLQVSSLEDTISADNPVRFIDDFVNSIDLVTIGFTLRVLKTEVRPSFDTKVFLKIYLYGYLKGIRSSRKLEKECIRYLGMQWHVEAICI